MCSGHGTCKCTGSLRNETMCECSTRFAGPDCSVCNTQYRYVEGRVLAMRFASPTVDASLPAT